AVVKPMASDAASTVRLVAYEPNRLKYEVNSNTGGTIVFSEIYYPGWRSSIDGQEVLHGRANYILRAMNVPAGQHEVEFCFDPVSLHVTENIAFIALGLLGLLAVAALYLSFKRLKKEKIS
ncbi:MAG: YfhO family protein, partial [Bacteroidaceae bacterium]|nr:YfhO family protein [Bacteroidaceae bacterium]